MGWVLHKNVQPGALAEALTFRVTTAFVKPKPPAGAPPMNQNDWHKNTAYVFPSLLLLVPALPGIKLFHGVMSFQLVQRQP